MSYKFGYPYILEFDYDYVAQVLLSSLRAGVEYTASLTLSLGGQSVQFDNFVPRPEAVTISHDGQKGGRVVALFRLASGTATPSVDRYEISAPLGGAVLFARKLQLGAVGNATVKALAANGSELAAGGISKLEMEKLGLRAKAEMDIRIDTNEFVMDFTVAEVGGRSGSIVVGLYGPKATAPKLPSAPGITHPRFPTPDANTFSSYPGNLTSKAEFGAAVDQHMLETGLNYVVNYRALAELTAVGINITINSIDTKVTGLNWPISYTASSEIRGTVNNFNIFVSEGPKRLKLNGTGLPRLVAAGKNNLKTLRLDSTSSSLQEFKDSDQDWGAPNTAVKGWAAWVAATEAEFPTHNEPNDIEPVELTTLTGPKDFMFGEGPGNAPEWSGADGSVKPPASGRITLRKGETVRLDVRNAPALAAKRRVPFVVFAFDAPTGVAVAKLPTRVDAGKSGVIDVSFSGTGYQKQDLILYTNDGVFKVPLEVYAEDGKYATANTVNVVAKNFRDYTRAGGSIGSDRGVAQFSAVWVSGPPVDITVTRPNRVSEFDLIGPSVFRLSSSNRQQTFTVHYDAGMRRPWQPLLEEEVLFTTPAPPTIKRVRISGSITRPHIYIPDVLMPIVARAYQHGQIKDAIVRMERFLNSLKEGPDIPLPPGPGPRPMPPYATDWAVVSAPALPAGNEFAFVSTSGETLTTAMDRDRVGAKGLMHLPGGLEGVFHVGEAPDDEAWLDVLFEFWSVREWSHTDLSEPVSAMAWHGDKLVVASDNRVTEHAVSRLGRVNWSSEAEMDWPVDGLWPAGRGLLLQSEGALHLSPVGVGEGLAIGRSRTADFPIEVAACVSFSHLIVVGEGRVQLLEIANEMEPVAEAGIYIPVTNALVVAPNSAVLIGPEGCAIARVVDDGLVVEQFHHDPVHRFEAFGRSLLVIDPDGLGQMIDLWVDWPKVEAAVNLEALPDETGIAVEAMQAGNGGGRTAIVSSGGYRLEIRETVKRLPRAELFDEEMEAF